VLCYVCYVCGICCICSCFFDGYVSEHCASAGEAEALLQQRVAQRSFILALDPSLALPLGAHFRTHAPEVRVPEGSKSNCSQICLVSSPFAFVFVFVLFPFVFLVSFVLFCFVSFVLFCLFVFWDSHFLTGFSCLWQK
jgi:hypothetical protein